MIAAAGIGLAEVLRVLAALAAVTGLTVALGWLARTRARRGGRATLQVQERLNLSRSAQLLVVKVGGRKLLLGASEKGVQLVTELEPDAAEAEAPQEDAAEDRPVLADETPQPVPGAFARLLARQVGGGWERPR